MNKIALIAVAGIAAAATAGSTATVSFSPASSTIDTTSTNAAERTVRVSVSISGSAGLTTFDAVLAAVEGEGLFTVANATLDNPFLFTAVPGISAITNAGPLGIRAFGSGPLFSGFDISGAQFSFDLIANEGALGAVTLTAQESGFSPIATNGLFADAYTAVIIGTASFNLVPAPGSLALLGLGGLAAARRRR